MFGSGSGRRSQKDEPAHKVAVLGLGRFGSSVALELESTSVEVLGIDSRPAVINSYADQLTSTAIADTTDPEAMTQLDLPSFDRVVVGIGSDLEASILTTSVLVDLQVEHIWAKAITRQHGRILDRIGAHHVVLPEHDMGERVAHLVIGKMMDYIKFEDDFALVKTHAPESLLGKAFAETRPRSAYGITIVGLKRPGENFTYATERTVPQRGDVLIVSGTVAQVEQFANHA
ncbi:trk system potassium uptake protein TrkA [Microlunatus soli]|uniref:Trk system potassium uptake protein TrkA n=2 Tax=Microlunatus soli TaxID=630515 RepID=A0A1H1U6L6_9ACTN|nr:trk system potassium uptake protein TrkA [Microlunatus soli]